MARKHSLTDLTKQKLTAVNSDENASDASLPPNGTIAGSRRVIGAVSQSFEKLRAQGVVELDPNLIDPPLVKDRIGLDEESLNQLIEQIKESGQLVPILVRAHPAEQGRYQLAYGWRRTQAARRLGVPVKGVIKKLTDDELVVAQGQENNARQDLTFIEKALYATNLESEGFDRQTIMAALGIDKTTCSKLISTTTKIPKQAIEAIGSAPKTGRDRWVALAVLCDADGAAKKVSKLIKADEFKSLKSDDRFNLVFQSLKAPKPKKALTDLWTSSDGKTVAKIKRDKNALTLVVDEKVAPEFGDFVVDALPELYAAFVRRVKD